jgi:hypothetical protein
VGAVFATLRTKITNARGASAGERKALLATAQRAAAEWRQRNQACVALRTLEGLRVAFRKAGVSPGEAVDAVELAIVATPRGAPCAHGTRRTRIEPERVFGGPLGPLAPVQGKPDEAEGIPTPPVRGTPDQPEPGPPTTVTPASGGGAPAGSNPFSFSMITDLVSAKNSSATAEPSQATAGKVVWYTGNSGAAFSLDGGTTFTHVDPRLMFPEIGHAFCCDQLVVYASQIDRFVWYAQYWCPEPTERCDDAKDKSNYVRLLVASPEGIARHRDDPGAAWTSYRIEPKDLGHRKDWFDYPDLAVGSHSLYFTSNVYHDGTGLGSVVARAPLAALKAGRGFALDYHKAADEFSYRIAQGKGTRAFMATHGATPRQLLTLTWDEGSPLLFPHVTHHAVSAYGGYESRIGADGSLDWENRVDPRITGATRRGNELWFAWPEGRSICRSRCNTANPEIVAIWPQPHVHVVVVDARSFRLVSERFIHNPEFAIAYPALATDSLGRVGMTFSYGGGTAGNASPAAGYLTGGEQFRQVAESPEAGQQGDYVSIQPGWPDGKQFTASGYVFHSDGGFFPTPHWLFYRFARER